MHTCNSHIFCSNLHRFRIVFKYNCLWSIIPQFRLCKHQTVQSCLTPVGNIPALLCGWITVWFTIAKHTRWQTFILACTKLGTSLQTKNLNCARSVKPVPYLGSSSLKTRNSSLNSQYKITYRLNNGSILLSWAQFMLLILVTSHARTVCTLTVVLIGLPLQRSWSFFFLPSHCQLYFFDLKKWSRRKVKFTIDNLVCVPRMTQMCAHTHSCSLLLIFFLLLKIVLERCIFGDMLI